MSNIKRCAVSSVKFKFIVLICVLSLFLHSCGCDDIKKFSPQTTFDATDVSAVVSKVREDSDIASTLDESPNFFPGGGDLLRIIKKTGKGSTFSNKVVGDVSENDASGSVPGVSVTINIQYGSDCNVIKATAWSSCAASNQVNRPYWGGVYKNIYECGFMDNNDVKILKGPLKGTIIPSDQRCSDTRLIDCYTDTNKLCIYRQSSKVSGKNVNMDLNGYDAGTEEGSYPYFGYIIEDCLPFSNCYQPVDKDSRLDDSGNGDEGYNGYCKQYPRGLKDPVAKIFRVDLNSMQNSSGKIVTEFADVSMSKVDCSYDPEKGFEKSKYPADCDGPLLADYRFASHLITNLSDFQESATGGDKKSPSYLKTPGEYILCVGESDLCNEVNLSNNLTSFSTDCEAIKVNELKDNCRKILDAHKKTLPEYLQTQLTSLKSVYDKKGAVLEYDFTHPMGAEARAYDALAVPLFIVTPDNSVSACIADNFPDQQFTGGWVGSTGAPTDDFSYATDYYAKAGGDTVETTTVPYCCSPNETFSVSVKDASNPGFDTVGCCYDGVIVPDETLFYDNGTGPIKADVRDKPSAPLYCTNSRIYKYTYDTRDGFKPADENFNGQAVTFSTLAHTGVLYTPITYTGSSYNDLGFTPLTADLGDPDSVNKSKYWLSTKGWNEKTADSFVPSEGGLVGSAACAVESGTGISGVGCCGDDFNDFFENPLKNEACWDGITVPNNSRVFEPALSKYSFDKIFSKYTKDNNVPDIWNPRGAATIGDIAGTGSKMAGLDDTSTLYIINYFRNLASQEFSVAFDFNSIGIVVEPGLKFDIFKFVVPEKSNLSSYALENIGSVYYNVNEQGTLTFDKITTTSTMASDFNLTRLFFTTSVNDDIPINKLRFELAASSSSTSVFGKFFALPSYFSHIANMEGQFYVCDPDHIPNDVFNIRSAGMSSAAHGEDSQMDLVSKSEAVDSCQPKGDFICSINDGWSRDIYGELYNGGNPEAQGASDALAVSDGFNNSYTAKNRTFVRDVSGLGYSQNDPELIAKGMFFSECCAPNACWDGKKCVPYNPIANLSGRTAVGKDGKTYVCKLKFTPGKYPEYTDAYWEVGVIKSSWNDVQSLGHCGETDCILPQFEEGSDDGDYGSYGFVGSNIYGASWIDDAGGLYDYGRCVPHGWYDRSDNFCVNGNWSSRTKYLAMTLIDYATKQGAGDHYALQCGDYNSVINEFVYTINYGQNTASLENFLKEQGSDKIGKLCVLDIKKNTPDEQVIVGSVLNSELNVSDAEGPTFAYAYSDPLIYGKPVGMDYLGSKDKLFTEMPGVGNVFVYCSNDAVTKLLGALQFGACSESLTKFIWYNPSLKTVIYSRDGTGIDLGQGVVSLDDFLRAPLFTIIQAVLSHIQPSVAQEDINFINNTKRFNNLYLQVSGNKKMQGFLENRYYDSRSTFLVNYEGVNLNCNNLNLSEGIACDSSSGNIVVHTDAKKQIGNLQLKQKLFKWFTSNTRIS